MLAFTVAAAVALDVTLALVGPLSATGLSLSGGRRTLVFFFLRNEA
jgi:hypothetical protein